ncbi:MAG: hypothetical protein FWB85_02545 [Chitinispirillia bacterium]|nr:hypothetical protein [Chitinispirillia bacterium]MCL2241263.1 hypothetical protein [Chitinispirillia bacterium]
MADNKNDAWVKEAAVAARQFIMMFNAAMLYGCEHPNVAKNAASFAGQVNTIFYGRELITFIVANGTLMVEDWPLDKTFNTTKILQHFEKIGLSSVSFEQGVDAGSVIRFVMIAGNTTHIETRKEEVARAQAGGIPFVRVNYILFGKIKAGEVVVRESEVRATGTFAPPGSPAGYPPQGQYPPQAQYPPQGQYPAQGQYPPPGQYAPAAPSAVNYDDAFLPPVTAGALSRESVAQIEEVLTLSSLIERPRDVTAALAEADSSEVQSAFSKIRGEMDGSAVGVDSLLQSLYGMKQDLYQAIEVQKATGRVMQSAEAINTGINGLTSRALVKLIEDEYKSGKTPLNRLAHTIRRMLPGNMELMQILPGMKEMLLAGGMSLSEYLELVSMLGLKMESESLSESLKEAAESMGASVADLVSAIRSKPEEAARLIFLASEIRRGADGAPDLSGVLTGYIEDVCSKMAVQACGAGDAQSGSLRQVLAQLETQLFGQLSKQNDIPPSILNDVKQRLAERFSGTCAAANESLPESKKQPVSAKIKMPPESLNPNNLFFLLSKEIKRSLRYKTPFSTVLISIVEINSPDGVKQLALSDTAELLPQLFIPVEALLRDVDMIGTLGTDAPELFIMLPMTGEEGTATVKERIVRKTAGTPFISSGRQVTLTVKVSSASPAENTTDLKSYMVLVRANHRKEK